MALQTKLIQKLSQSLLMTPQLQHAIKLLQLGRPEYREAIERELLENPILEMVSDTHEDADGSPGLSTPAEEEFTPHESYQNEDHEIDFTVRENPDWEEGNPFEYSSQGASSQVLEDDTLNRIDNLPNPQATLQSHLLDQLRELDASLECKEIILHFIGNIDKDGFLSLSLEEVGILAKVSIDKVNVAYSLAMEFDPPGVFARSHIECLLFQLHRLDKRFSLEARLITEHADRLESRRYDLIAKKEKCTIEAVQAALKVIQTLNPRPGRYFNDELIRYAEPDVFVRKIGNEYYVIANDEGIPQLQYNSFYTEMMKQPDGLSSQQKSYLNDKMRAASWLLKSIHQRQRTIVRTTESIVKFQRDFFEFGISRLKPLVLKDVADDISMHESTISRITTNKFVHTPQGIFELKFFFSTGIKTAQGDISSSSIKERIKSLILAESPTAPVSDQLIVDTLKGEGVEIARRTVAKYREALGIPSSNKRRTFF
jgi:RNA polymerase sigma-54 factor